MNKYYHYVKWFEGDDIEGIEGPSLSVCEIMVKLLISMGFEAYTHVTDREL